MPNPHDDLLPDDDNLPVTDLDRLVMAIGEIVAALRCPEVTVDAERAVNMLADAVNVSVLAVPRDRMRCIDQLADVLVGAVSSAGRRNPTLRPRLVQDIQQLCREFDEVIGGWAAGDETGIEKDPLSAWTFAPRPTVPQGKV